MNWTPYVIVWICMGAGTLGLALYRKLLANREDDRLHVDAWQAPQVTQQETMAHKLHMVDRYGETLSVLTVLGGLVLGIAYLYVALARG